MPNADELGILAMVVLIAVLAWIAYQIRKLHADLQPVIESTLVRTLTAA